jgi:uncharacterized protein
MAPCRAGKGPRVERVPITEGLFELDGDELVLIGGYSPTSGEHHFPLSDTCPYSGATDVERVALSREGRLWAWTSVTIPPAGYLGDVPYGFGVVELPEGLKVVARLTEPDVEVLSFGQPMRLVAERICSDEEGRAVVSWAFAPLEAVAA